MQSMELHQIERMHGDDIFCLEDCFATLCKWYETDYELMFIYSWDFYYKDDKRNHSSVENVTKNLYPVKHNKEIPLHKYHGLHIEQRVFQGMNEELEFLITQFKEKTPVIALFDSYWCPWEKGYKKNNSGLRYKHAILLTGYNDITGNFICEDPFYNLHNFEYGKSEFWNGYLYSYWHKYRAGVGIYFKDIIKDITDNLEDTFECMKNYALAVRDCNVWIESSDFVQPEFTNIWAKLSLLERGRFEFAISLRYMAEKFRKYEKHLDKIKEEILECAYLWGRVKNLSGKLLFRPLKQEQYRREVVGYFRDIAIKEEQVLKNLRNLMG